MEIVIGTKKWSTWSLRPWLALKRTSAPFTETVVQLREAELSGGRLAGVGARIVAETFHRAIEGSRFSIVRDAGFKPSFGPDDQTFDMRDLLFFAFEGKKSLLAPLG